MHYYSHLLTGAAANLECAACLQVDDIEEPQCLDRLMEHALAFLSKIGEAALAISYQHLSESRHRRLRLPAFRSRMIGKGHMLGGTLRSLTITAAGFEDNELSKTWTPRAVFSVGLHGRILEAFIQTPKASDTENGYLTELANQVFDRSFAAAYIFPYPWVFSPLAYCTGLSYSPSVRALGNPTHRDSERVANWANHCYRGHRASDGYLREIYPLNLVSDRHLEASVAGARLEAWIRSDPRRGSLTRFGEKWLWAVDERHLPMVQLALDRSGLLLASFPPAR